MINNRQNGRRRGRGGGQRPGGGGGGQGQRDSGNRIDSRARGNAAQLLEKYRNMARDAQMSGDRVNTEYYLQFADHYFRVLADQRGRSEEQGQRRPQRDDFDQFDMDDDFGSDFAGEGDPIRADEQPRASEADAPRAERRDREGRDRDGRDREERPRFTARENGRDRSERGDRPQRTDRERQPRAEAQPGHEERAARPTPPANDLDDAPLATPVEAELPLAEPQGDAQAEAPRRRGRPRKVRDEQPIDAPVAFEADRLPPAIGAPASDAAEAGDAEEAPKPRRRRVRAAEATPAE